jgi:hypothetical protein
LATIIGGEVPLGILSKERLLNTSDQDNFTSGVTADMRATLVLLAAVGRSSAAWLRWTEGSEPTWKPAQETGRIPNDDQVIGWTPKPTPAPGVRPEGEAVLDLLKRASYTTTNWTNPETCGWVSGSSCEFLLGFTAQSELLWTDKLQQHTPGHVIRVQLARPTTSMPLLAPRAPTPRFTCLALTTPRI